MRIATMATGGIGGFLAVKLTQAGHEVATIARGPHLQAIQRDGLVLESMAGREVVQPWMATNDPSKVGTVDAIIFGVKTGGLDAAAKACVPMVGPHTVVVPFLNGVEAADRLKKILPPQSVANGMAQVSTTIAEPGVIRQVGEFNTFTFAECDSRPSTRIDALRSAINTAGSNAPETDDIARDVWTKFVVFSAMSGVTAAARCKLGDIRASAELTGLFQGVMAETAALARAMKIRISDHVTCDMWAFVQGLPEAMRASTAIDLEQGNPLEIDYISGAVARLSAAAGLDAPLNRTLHAVLSPYRDGSSLAVN